MIPFVVVEGTREQFDQAVGDAVAAGWIVDELEGWDAADRRTASDVRAGIVLSGAVTDPVTAAAAVSAAVAGRGLVIHGLAARETLDALCDDLRHLGRLDHRVGLELPVLSAEDWLVLRALSGGASVAAVADLLHMSRRSADRRIAALRGLFGVDSVDAALQASRERLARIGMAPGR